jgi:hypothetical protein
MQPTLSIWIFLLLRIGLLILQISSIVIEQQEVMDLDFGIKQRQVLMAHISQAQSVQAVIH